MSEEQNEKMYGYDHRQLPVVVIEVEAIDDYLPLIGAGPFALYIVLIRFTQKGVHCPSQKGLANMLRIKDVKTIRTYLDVLCDHKLIKVLPRFIDNMQTTSEYRIMPLGKISLPSREKFPTESSTTSFEGETESTPLSRVAAIYQNSTGGISALEAQQLDDLITTHGEDFVIAAIKEAVFAGKRRMSTVIIICQSAAADGRWPGEWKQKPDDNDTFHSTMREV